MTIIFLPVSGSVFGILGFFASCAGVPLLISPLAPKPGTAHFPWIVMGLSSGLFDPLLLRTVLVLPPQQTVPPALLRLRQAALAQQTRLLLVLRTLLAQMLPVTAPARARKLETPQTLLAQQTLSRLPLRAVLDAQSVRLPPFCRLVFLLTRFCRSLLPHFLCLCNLLLHGLLKASLWDSL